MSRTTSIFNKLEKAGSLAEDGIIFVILLSMILLAGTQIFLRNLFDSSLFWGDEMLRMMVLWLTVTGGLAASRINKHISISVLDRFLPARFHVVTHVVTELFTSIICALLCLHSARFVIGSYEFGDKLLQNTPAWILQIIVPIAFGLMAYRHLINTVRHVFALLEKEVPS